ncbi:ABC transporter permease [Flavihumibacter sp. RY-1]|uniref:ABC transporter permease n=1 Tax=Flavihumibacter fluminis TaxID=2909236 RepID=A0ABS9BHI3_9BACT|nr:ABC transporter permease [Flavihumibacter fluminis]MCF1714760.1 ABC transporter permease [Flavihumibacter fluminis]
MRKVPKSAVSFLRWFCREDYIEEIEGDLLEVFFRQEQFSPRLAKLAFWINVLMHFRPAFIKKVNIFQPIPFLLIKYHIKIGWRRIRSNSFFSAINVIGLSIALLCCIAITLYVYDEYQFDRFHKNLPQLYRVVEKQNQAGVLYDVASTPGPLGPAMEIDFPEVQQVCRFGRTIGSLHYGEKQLEPKDIRYTDNSIFSMFDFRLLKGDQQRVLTNPEEVVITESTAIRIWGEEWRLQPDVIGSTITLTSWGKEFPLRVTGIAEDPPVHSHIQFSVLLSFKALEGTDYFTWDNNAYSTYLLLDPDVQQQEFNTKLRTYIDRYSEYGSENEARTLRLQPMKDIYLFSDFDFGTNDAKAGNIVALRIFSIAAIMIFVIAIFNFINLCTAKSLNRSKEVGVRKIMGANRGQLISQYLVEASMLSGIAVVVSLMLVQLFLPFINAISGKQVALPWLNPGFWCLVVLFSVVVGILAGIYPAFYLSRTRSGIKSNAGYSTGFKSPLRKLLVVGQFSLAVLFMIASIIIFRQLQFMQEKELGFNQDQLIYVTLKNELRQKAGLLKNELKKMPGITEVVPTSSNLVDANSSTTQISWEGQLTTDEFLITQVNTDADMLPAMGIQLQAGRNFYEDGSDSGSYIINESAAKRMGWTAESAIGKKLSLWNAEGKVIGVVNDFHFQPLTRAIEPFLFRSWMDQPYSGLLIKIEAGQVAAALTSIEEQYKKLERNSTLQFQFLDQAISQQYFLQQKTSKLVLICTILAVFISCLGLFGLAMYAAEQRQREIGIRKVLGASILNIVNLLTSDIVRLVMISILIAVPVAYWCMNKWIQDFAYRIELDAWLFLVASLSIMLIAFITVSFQSIRAALMNPVKSIKVVS